MKKRPSLQSTWMTQRGAERARCGCCGCHSFVRICWWGSSVNPQDIRIHGPRGRVLADGVRTSLEFLGV